MKRNRFVLYCEYREQVDTLTDAQAGALMKALMAYADDETKIEFTDPVVKICFSFIRAQMDRDTVKWEDTIKARSEAGKKGGAPKGNRNAAKKQTKQAKQRENENENVNENENENENENVNVCVNVDAHANETTPTAPHTHTSHTDKQEVLTLADVLDKARARGYKWDGSEGERFLQYNRDKGRTQGWDFAMERWEEQRRKRGTSPAASSPPARAVGITTLADYDEMFSRYERHSE